MTTVDHSAWQRILQRHVSPSADGVNRFAYGQVSVADRQALKQYIGSLEDVRVSALDAREQQAFWINLYNALTIDVVLDHAPVQSIREIEALSEGPWKTPRVTVEGRALSLNDIEHGILRKTWRDPRVHYAVNCASMSCPNLMAEAFTGEKLEQMLTQGARDYINHSRAVRVEEGKVVLSEIYSWYRRDFGASDADILRHVARYAAPALSEQLSKVETIAGYGYDWSLNETK